MFPPPSTEAEVALNVAPPTAWLSTMVQFWTVTVPLAAEVVAKLPGVEAVK